MRAQAVLFVSVACLCLANLGCATVANTLLPPSEEKELGKQLSAEVEQLTLLEDPAINAWVKQMGTDIALAGRKDIPKGIQFTFKVVDDDETVNAFAMPGGYIYVYTGLLKKAENESEIAAVMGHEISHVTRRHIAKRLTAMYGISALTSVALGENPGLVAEIVSNVATNGYLLKHSRDAERESDKYGMDYMVRAGYSPKGYATFFTKLAESPSPPAIISSHPDPKERVANAQKRIRRYSAKVRDRDLGVEAYNNQISALK